MAYCYQMKMFCEFASIEGYCQSSACQKGPSITYEAYTMTPMTNADRIRAMSDEEIAASEFLLPCPYIKDMYDECKFGWHDREQSCEECKLEWLKRPAEEEQANEA